MKKAKNIFLILICLLVFSSCVGSCGYFIPFLPSHVPEEETPYAYPAFETAHTEEEHLQKIRSEIENVFSDSNYAIENYRVELVYSFYENKPEYYVITVESKEEYAHQGTYWTENGIENYTTNYRHIVGRIVKDTYTHCGNVYGAFVFGRSPWEFCRYGEGKKYYGNGIYGVATEEGILQIFDNKKASNEPRVEFMDYTDMKSAITQKILSLDEQKQIQEQTSSTFALFKLLGEEIDLKTF